MQSFLVSQPVINFYRYALFFAILILHSHFVFSQTSVPTIPTPTCATQGQYVCNASIVGPQCANDGGFLVAVGGQCWDNSPLLQCNGQCTCPSPYTFGKYYDQAGNLTSGCAPPSCPEGSSWSVELNRCTSDEPDSCPSGFPPVNGQCPVCVGEQNPDGTCASDNGGSSAGSSGATSSSPDSGSSGSDSSAGGDDGNPDNPGTGGGGDGSGGNTNGSGSASSSNSSFNNNSWNPYSGYGNWIPIDADSPCPNKYKDISGQWWCAGNGLGAASSGSSASADSNNSNSSGSAGSNGSASSTSSSCPAKPQCEKNTGIESADNSCKQLLQEYYSACPGNPTENGLFDIDKDELADGKPLSFSNSLTDFKTELAELVTVQQLENFFQFNGSGSCPVWQVSAWVFDVVIDQQCSPDIPWGLIAGIIIAVSILLATRIALT